MMAVQYVLLPVLAQSLGLSYTQVGLLKASSSTAMAVLEIPSGFLAEKFGETRLLCAKYRKHKRYFSPSPALTDELQGSI